MFRKRIKLDTKYICFSLLIVVGLGFSAESDSTAFLTIPLDQDSLLVLLDNSVIGKTPIHVPISTGAHELVVQSPHWPSWDQHDYQNSFVALPGQEYRFEPEFKNVIAINSIPFGATVIYKSEEIGKTPVNIFVENDSKIKIELEGYLAREVLINLPGQSFYLAQLLPEEGWVLAKLEQEERKHKKLGRNKKLLFASLGFAAAAGLSTAHFRSRGNEEYDNYQNTAIPSNMDEYFSNAQYFDRIASLSYVFFELGFVLSGYFFLTSRE